MSAQTPASGRARRVRPEQNAPLLAILAPLCAGALALRPAPAAAGRADVAGYVRVGTRPDFQGGGGTLGYWNLYGRLLNERPYAALELKYDVLERTAASQNPWTSVHMRIEGGAVSRATAEGGSLAGLQMSQLYVRAGNVLLPNVTWQVGTLHQYFGDLGLYDMRPAQIFFETVGASARYENDVVDVVVGFGDSGFFLRPEAYSTVLTPGGMARVRLGDYAELGGGGMVRYEPKAEGNRNAPHVTPGIDYEQWVRGEVVQQFLAENPNRPQNFPRPQAVDARSWKGIGYLGFGGFGPVRWNNLFASVERLHPTPTAVEDWQGQSYTLYVTELTDERTVTLIGDELQLRVIPQRFDFVLAGLWGRHTNGDNTLVPSDENRRYKSLVGRGQLYLTDTVHWLTESSIAKEVSENGNTFREHKDSIFANTGGQPDTRGLETGDTDTRITWQGKAGVVLNPLGPGVYSRPSLRFLYGVQHSNQNNAFGNAFVETVDQYNFFGNVEQHWHQVVSLEAEAWF